MTKGPLGKLYKDGEVVVRQGETGDCMYVVQDGEVEVLASEEGRDIALRTLGPGEIIGEMSLFDREVRSATVRAKGEARLLTIDKATFLRRVHEDPSLALQIVRNMSRRIRDLSRELAQSRSGR